MTIDLERFRTLLNEREQALRERLDTRAHGAEAGAASGTLSVAHDAASAEDADVRNELNDDAFAEIQVADRELAQVRQALDRIDQGGYGECIDCGDPIPEERLQVEPWALRDIKCQEAYEQRHSLNPQGSIHRTM